MATLCDLAGHFKMRWHGIHFWMVAGVQYATYFNSILVSLNKMRPQSGLRTDRLIMLGTSLVPADVIPCGHFSGLRCCAWSLDWTIVVSWPRAFERMPLALEWMLHGFFCARAPQIHCLWKCPRTEVDVPWFALWRLMPPISLCLVLHPKVCSLRWSGLPRCHTWPLRPHYRLCMPGVPNTKRAELRCKQEEAQRNPQLVVPLGGSAQPMSMAKRRGRGSPWQRGERRRLARA